MCVWNRLDLNKHSKIRLSKRSKVNQSSVVEVKQVSYYATAICHSDSNQRSIDHFRIMAIWPGDRIRRPEHPTENEVRRCSCNESV